MKAKTGLAVLLFVGCVSGVAAQPKPYQLCMQEGMSNARSIATNYRYPPKPPERTPTDRFRFECPVSEPYGMLERCYSRTADCERVNLTTDQCAENRHSWYDEELLRLRQIDLQGQPLYAAWPPNPAVQRVVAFPYHALIDVYRQWPFAPWPGRIPQLLERRERRFYEWNNIWACHTMAHLVGFFNGVWNTKAEAENSLEEIEKQDFLGPDWRGAPIRYELFYNQSCKQSSGGACLQDVAEVFRQRSAEIDGLLGRRWEYFWEQVTGQHKQAGSFTQRLVARVVRADNALAHWFDALGNAVLAKITALTTLLAENPPTAQDTAGHTAQLIAAGQRAERAVLVAHSQGNLFVNAAYDAYLAHARQAGAAVGEDTGYVAAQVVHIAPASPTLRGPYVLASSDLVINGLRRVDGTYLPVSNANLALNGKDPSGHKLLDTYLDEARPLRAQIRQLITGALDAL